MEEYLFALKTYTLRYLNKFFFFAMYTQTQKYAMPQVVVARIFMTLTFDLISILIRNILKQTKINIFGDLDR